MFDERSKRCGKDSLSEEISSLSNRFPDGKFPLEETAAIFKDTAKELLEGVPKDELRRLVFGATYMAEQHIRQDGPFADLGIADLTRRYAVHALKEFRQRKAIVDG